MTFAWWRWRLSQAFARNPLVRISDRIEALVFAMAVVTSLAAIPLAGAMATAVHDERGRAYAAQLQDRRQITATVTADSVTLPKADVNVVQARWQFGGVQHHQRFQWQEPVAAGQTIDIAVHPDGRRAAPLDPWWRAGVEAGITGLTFWLAVTFAAALLFAVLRPCLNRVRNAAWDRDIASLADDGGTNRRS